MLRTPVLCTITSVCCLLAAPRAVSAQATPPAAPPAQTPPAAQAPAPGAPPPVMTFSPEGLTLEEALRLALQWDPDLHLQRANVQSREGALREQAGIFDLGFRASTTYDFRQ